MIPKLNAVRAVFAEYRRAAALCTSRPVLAISSDDWGGGCITNVHEETVENLHTLSEALLRHKDSFGNPAIFNLYVVGCRPDFDAIEKNGYSEYRFVPTYEKKPEIVAALKEGLAKNVFRLGYHGRDHFQAGAWLKALREGDEFFKSGFRQRRVSYRDWPGYQDVRNAIPTAKYFGASEFLNISTLPSQSIPVEIQSRQIHEGLTAFEHMFGFKPATACAPGYIFDTNTERVMALQGCKYIESMPISCMQVTQEGENITRMLNYSPSPENGLHILIRNAHYEPGWHGNESKAAESVYKSLVMIRRAFIKGEPVILSTHAQNFTGEKERVNSNILGLEKLLDYVRKQWPDVAFMSAEELGGLIRHEKSERHPNVTARFSSRNGKNTILSTMWNMATDYGLRTCLKIKNLQRRL